MGVWTPQLRLRIGNENLTPIPPEYVQEFTFTSRLNWYEIEVSLIEPWEMYYQDGYVPLETRLIESDVLQGTSDSTSPDGERVLAPGEQIDFQIGLTNEAGQTVWSEQLRVVMANLELAFSDAGVEIHMVAFCDHIAKLQTKGADLGKVYTGCRSDVVYQFCRDYGFYPLIEKTADSAYEQDAEGNAVKKLKEWAVGTLTPGQFLRDKVLPGAISMDGRADYELQFRPGNLLVFAPPVSKTWHHGGYKKYTYLFSKQDEVINFKPDFNSKMLGAWGRGGFLSRQYNPHTKELETKQITRDNSGSTKGVGVSTHVVEYKNIKNGDIAHIASSKDSVDNSTDAKSNWAALNDTTFTSSIEWMGTFNTMPLRGGDIVHIDVILPTGKAHWSGGDWLLTEVKHTIESTGQYTVSATAQRDFSNTGEISSTKYDNLMALNLVEESPSDENDPVIV